jgi:hypothetical protein
MACSPRTCYGVRPCHHPGARQRCTAFHVLYMCSSLDEELLDDEVGRP